MSPEKFPSKKDLKTVPESEKPEKKEDQTLTFQEVLSTVQKAKEAGVTDIFDTDNPRADKARDAIEFWESDAGLSEKGIETVEKAHDMVRLATVELEAGSDDPGHIEAAITRLADEHAIAVDQNRSEAILSVLTDALDALEKRLALKENPEKIQGRFEKMKLPASMKKEIKKAQEEDAGGKPRDAFARLIYLTCISPNFKRISKEAQEALVAYREELKQRA